MAGAFLRGSVRELRGPLLLLRREGVGAADDLGDLLGDLGLTRVVRETGELADERVGVVTGGLHGLLAGGVLGSGRLQHGVEDAALDVHREQRVEDGVGVGLELVERQGLAVRRLLHALDDLEREQAHDLRLLGREADEPVEDDVDLVHAALGRVLEELRHDRVADLLRRRELGLVRPADPLPLGGTLAEREVPDRLATDEVEHDVLALAAEQGGELLALLEDVRAERAVQAAVRGEQHHGCAGRRLGLGGQHVVDVRERRHGRHGPRHGPRVRTGRGHARLCLLDPRRRDQLHRAGDLLRGLRRLDALAVDPDLCRHLATTLDDLLLVDVLGLGRVERLRAERLAVARLEALREGVDLTVHRGDGLVAELVRLTEGGQDVGVATQVLEQLGLEAEHVGDGHLVELAVRAGPDRDDLLLDRVRRVLRLLEELGQAGTTVQLTTRRLVEVGREHRERLERAVLRQLELERAGDLLDRLDLGVTTDARHRDAHVDGRTLVRVEQVRLQEDLAVGDRDHVGRDVRRHVVRLGLDDGQTRHRPGAEVVGQLRATLQQTGVQVEDVTRVRLAARRTTQEERHRTVGLGLLRQVVEDDEDVLAAVHPVLADGRTGVGGEVLEAGRVGGGSGDDGGVLHRTGVLERTLDGGDRGALLADGDVDAADLLVLVARLPVGLLVDDRVDRDGRLAGLAVADDQLTLTAADGDHRVDGLDAGLQRLVDRLAGHDARGLELEGTTALGLDLAETVDRVAERVDHATEEAVADGGGEDLAGAGDLLALLDAAELAEHDGADLVLVEVLRETEGPVLEADELVRHDAGQALDVRDAVARVGDVPDLGRGGLRRLVVRDEVLQGITDLIGADGDVCHGIFLVGFRGPAAPRG
ncbi:acetylglutamate semialdehyde dehydrogenase [Curtobacterium sp. ER1/6]|nr:acetylglutamate semialdehyde dehydrogenase [Curtobacterium sp. ER1/6]